MHTISVPISDEMDETLNDLVRRGEAKDVADAIRRALARIEEDRIVADVEEALQDVREGRVIEGDLREILTRMP